MAVIWNDPQYQNSGWATGYHGNANTYTYKITSASSTAPTVTIAPAPEPKPLSEVERLLADVDAVCALARAA